MNVIVGSNNPVKIEAVKRAFSKAFPGASLEVTGCDADSGVSVQPMNDESTVRGASNRAAHCRSIYPEADYWIGLEGGCQFNDDNLEAFAWMVILSENKKGKARTASFVLPKEVAALVKNGLELGEADDIVFQQNDSKQKNGAVGILTNNLIDRTSYYEQALILALIPFINSSLYN